MNEKFEKMLKMTFEAQKAELSKMTQEEVVQYMEYATHRTKTSEKKSRNNHCSDEQLVEYRNQICNLGNDIWKTNGLFSSFKRKAAYNGLLSNLIREAGDLTVQMRSYPIQSAQYAAALKSLETIARLIQMLKAEQSRNLGIKLGALGPLACIVGSFLVQKYGEVIIDKTTTTFASKIPGVDKWLGK